MSADDEPSSTTTRSADPESVMQFESTSNGVPRVRDPKRYDIICEHGRGGLGRVSRAHDRELGRDVAIKELLSRGPISEARFAREARITARLEHPGIVPVHEAGRWPDGTPFYAMKLVSGRPLRALIAERGTVDERIQLLHHVIAVADAMAYAHGQNIIHRDLKPGNVIVGEFGETVVIDWGLAKDLSDRAAPDSGDGSVGVDPELTAAGSVLGTPAYMPPEQERGEAVDQRADVFAIGAMLWELCSLHKVPPRDLAQRHRLLRQARIDDDLVTILDKALDPDPDRRYCDAGALAADLNAFKSGARISTRRYSLLALLAHWRRRHRALAAAMIAFLALLLISVTALGMLYRASSTNAAVARTNAEIAQARLLRSYIERGRRALVEGKHDEALTYLVEAARRGERSPALSFMLDRAAEPNTTAVLRLPSQAARAWSAVFSADTRRILSADDGAARLWDARTGDLLHSFVHPAAVARALFTPDERAVVTFARDGAVRVWRVDTGVLVHTLRRSLLGGDEGALSPDGRFAAAIDRRTSVLEVWDLKSGSLVTSMQFAEPERLALEFSGDCQWLAFASRDAVQILDTRSWRLVSTLAAPRVRSLRFDPTGQRLVTGTGTGDVSIWQVASGTRLRQLWLIGEPVLRVAYSPDGAFVAAARIGPTGVAIWKARSGELQSRVTNATRNTQWIEFDATARTIITTGASNTLVVSDVLSGIPLRVLGGGKELISDAHFELRTSRVIAAALDGSVSVWDAAGSYRRWSTPPIGSDCGTDVTAQDDGRIVAVSCTRHGTFIVDTTTGRRLAELPAVAPVRGAFVEPYVALSHAGDRAAIPRGLDLELYDVASGTLLRVVRHTAAVTSARFSPVSDVVATGDTDGAIRVTRDRGVVFTTSTRGDAIDVLDFLPDGRLVAVDASPRLRIYDLSGSIRLELPLPVRMRALRISRDGRRAIAIPIPNAPVDPVLCDLQHGKVIAALTGHHRQVYSAKFVRDDHEILTAGTDGMARFWSGETGELHQTLFATEGMLFDAALSPDGRLVVTAGSDGYLRFWDRASGMMMWLLRAHDRFISAVHFEGRYLVSRGHLGDLASWEVVEPDESAKPLHRLERLVACGAVRLDEVTEGLVAQDPHACEASRR